MYFQLRNRKIVYARFPWTSPWRFVKSDFSLMTRCVAIGIRHLDAALIGSVFSSALAAIPALWPSRNRWRTRCVMLVDFSWRGGIAVYTRSLAHSLAECGWRVWECANQGTPGSPGKSIGFCSLFRPVRIGRSAGLLGRILKKIAIFGDYLLNHARLLSRVTCLRPQVLHFQTVMIPLLDQWTIRMYRWVCPRILLTVHNLIPHDADRDCVESFHRRLYRQFDGLIVHTGDCRRELIELVGSESPPVFVIPFPVAVIDPIPQPAARARLGLNGGSEIVLMFGQIRPYKGLDVLIEAFTRVASRRPRAQLAIVGMCENFTPYEKVICTKGLEKRIVTRIGFVPESECDDWFAAADVVCLPYRRISQSGVATRALAHGRALVASRVGGLPTVVRNGHNGRLVESGNVEELAQALAELLENQPARRRMEKNSLYIAKNELSWDAATRSTVDVYMNLREE